MNSHSVMRRKISRQSVVIWLTLLLLAGAGLRLVALDRSSFWVDELNTCYTAQSFANEGNFNLPSGIEYLRAPLQTIVTGLFFKVLPANEFSTRLPAALMGLLCVWMAYILAARVFNQRVALVTAFFMAFSHFEVGWSRTARMYTFLQFFALLFAFFVVRFLETRRGERMEAILWIKGETPLIRIKHFIARWGLSLGWILPALAAFAIAFVSIQHLAVFMPLSLMVYLGFMTFIALISFKGKERWLNKYSLLFLLISGAAAAAMVLLPELKVSLLSYLYYTPPWAVQGTAADPWRLLNFLMEPARFPLGALFYIGAVQVLTRYHRKGILTLMMFVVPFFLLSFVMAHRTPTYLFFAYPFFLMLAAFALVNLIEIESRVSQGILNRLEPAENRLMALYKKRIMVLVALALAAVFVISPWLRLTLSIPRNPDGSNNGAVTTTEWRGGMQMVTSEWRLGDKLISALPLSSLYYGRAAEYALNWSLLNQAKDKKSVNEHNQWFEFYSGTPCLESLEALQEVVEKNPRGWIILEQFHLDSPQYIPNDVRVWLENHMDRTMSTPLSTVKVFAWDHNTGAL